MPNDVVDIKNGPSLPSEDAATLLAALVSDARRVQAVTLSCGTVWIKRHGDKGRRAIVAVQNAVARVFRLPFMRPSPAKTAEGMVQRDLRRIAKYSQAGVPTAAVIYSSGSAIVLSDIAPTVQQQLRSLRDADPAAHDALLVFCAGELGRLHGAGLCHGRPYPRDMFIRGDRLGFIDFEEEPEAVMPMETAQARDLWLLSATERKGDRAPENAGSRLCGMGCGCPEGGNRRTARNHTFHGPLFMACPVDWPISHG